MGTPVLRHPRSSHRRSFMRVIPIRKTTDSVGNSVGSKRACLALDGMKVIVLHPKTEAEKCDRDRFICPIAAERWHDSACARSATKLSDCCAWCPGAQFD
jgi:hypothetical protein